VLHGDYGVGTVTDLNVYHTVIDFDVHGLRRFVTNMVVVERTADPGPTPSERRAITLVRQREERARVKAASLIEKPVPASRRSRKRVVDDEADTPVEA